VRGGRGDGRGVRVPKRAGVLSRRTPSGLSTGESQKGKKKVGVYTSIQNLPRQATGRMRTSRTLNGKSKTVPKLILAHMRAGGNRSGKKERDIGERPSEKVRELFVRALFRDCAD